MSSCKPTRPHRLPASPSHPRAVLCTLPLLCALALSSCGTSGTASTDASPAPSAQEASTASHSATPSTSADGQKSSTAPPQTASATPSQSTSTTQTPTPTPTDAAPGRHQSASGWGFVWSRSTETALLRRFAAVPLTTSVRLRTSRGLLSVRRWRPPGRMERVRRRWMLSHSCHRSSVPGRTEVGGCTEPREGGTGRQGGDAGEWACSCSSEGIFLMERIGRRGRYRGRSGRIGEMGVQPLVIPLAVIDHMIYSTKLQVDNLCTQAHTCMHKLPGGRILRFHPVSHRSPACH